MIQRIDKVNLKHRSQAILCPCFTCSNSQAPGISKTCSNYILSPKGINLLQDITKFAKNLPTPGTKIVRGVLTLPGVRLSLMGMPNGLDRGLEKAVKDPELLSMKLYPYCQWSPSPLINLIIAFELYFIAPSPGIGQQKTN